MSQAAQDQQRLREYLVEHFSDQLDEGRRSEETPVDTVLRVLEAHRQGSERLALFIDNRLSIIDEFTQQTIRFEPAHDAAILLLDHLLPDDEEDDEDDGDLPTAPRTPAPTQGAAT